MNLLSQSRSENSKAWLLHSLYFSLFTCVTSAAGCTFSKGLEKMDLISGITFRQVGVVWVMYETLEELPNARSLLITLYHSLGQSVCLPFPHPP